MADNKPTTPTPTPAQTTNWDMAVEKIEQVTNHLKNFEGKAGHNPFMYYKKFVQPLVDRYQSGERTPELYSAIFALKLEAPTVDKTPQAIGAITGLPKNKYG